MTNLLILEISQEALEADHFKIPI